MAEEDYDEFGNPNPKPSHGKEKRRKRKDKTRNQTVTEEEEEGAGAGAGAEENEAQLSSKASESREALSTENAVSEEAAERDGKRERKRLLKEAAAAQRRGVCYMSRVPPHMDPFKLRQLLSQHGDVERIYLAPENPSAQVRRKPGGRRQDVLYSEGWIEFSDKKVAKRVANMLNGEQIGGKKRSSLYYDLWNIKYLSKFKWDDLTQEISYKHAIREQKLSLELSAAKKERDFYLSRVDKARALSSIEERLKKKQKLQEDSGAGVDVTVDKPKVFRKFPQNRPVTVSAKETKPRLSKDILAGVFGADS